MTEARVLKIKGRLVLEDPVAEGVIQALELEWWRQAKQACRQTLEAQLDRVEHFIKRAKEARRSPREFVITLINVDDPNGGPLADQLMPGHDWDAIRAQGLTPYARGLATREGFKEILELIDKDAAAKLDRMKYAVVIVDHGTADVFDAIAETQK